MRTSARFGTKDSGFFEIYGVSARTRGEEGIASADILRTRGGSQFFAILFYGRLLSPVHGFVNLGRMLLECHFVNISL